MAAREVVPEFPAHLLRMEVEETDQPVEGDSQKRVDDSSTNDDSNVPTKRLKALEETYQPLEGDSQKRVDDFSTNGLFNFATAGLWDLDHHLEGDDQKLGGGFSFIDHSNFPTTRPKDPPLTFYQIFCRCTEEGCEKIHAAQLQKPMLEARRRSADRISTREGELFLAGFNTEGEDDNPEEAEIESRKVEKQPIGKRFSCPHCSRKFRRYEHVKRHCRYLHRAEKPFECAECGKRFSRSDNCIQHQRTHRAGPISVASDLSGLPTKDVVAPPISAPTGGLGSARESDTPGVFATRTPWDSQVSIADTFFPSDSQVPGGRTPTGSSDGAITPPALSFSESYSFGERARTEPVVFSGLPSSQGQKYQYTNIRFDQIRLLMVHKGAFEEPINCSMTVLTIEEIEELKINYYALSYAWGPKQYALFNLLDIHIQDTTAQGSARSPSQDDIPKGQGQPADLQSGSMSLLPNLFDALKRLRSIGEDLWFWIDAVCINQDDNDEKSIQIPNMLDIYSKAVSVCVWLGEEGRPLSENEDNFRKAPAIRPRTACILCKRRKQKCDGLDPCGYCKSNDVDCVLEHSRKKPPEKPPKKVLAQHDPLDFIPLIVNLKFLDNMITQRPVDEGVVASFVAFANLLKRPWFRRRWVIQEISASRQVSVHYGSKKINWIDFADAVQLFIAKIDRIREMHLASESFKQDPEALGHVESCGAGAIVTAANNLVRKSQTGKIIERLWDIESLVLTFLHFEASDPRDVVYALLALANDQDVSEPSTMDSSESPGNATNILQPSYTKSALLIYGEFVHHCISSSKSLDIICRHWAQPLRGFPYPLQRVDIPHFFGSINGYDYEFPTWIGLVADSPFGPPSEFTGRLNGDSLVGRHGNKVYKASKGMQPEVVYGEDPFYKMWQTVPAKKLALRAKGIVLGRIAQASSRVVGGTIPEECLRMAGWQKNMDINRVPDRLWRTLVADRASDGTKAPSWWRRACMYCLVKADYNGDLNTSSLLANSSLPDTVTTGYLKRVRDVTWNRKFFVCQESFTSERLFGIGSRYIGAGDLVCILFGCSVPVILRERKDVKGNVSFLFVGESYVDERMDGEALLGKDLDAMTRTFNIQ